MSLSPNKMVSIAVLGSGSYGTALAHVLAKADHQVKLWGRNAALCDTINATHENARYLPGCALHPALCATSDLKHAVSQAEWIIVAVPSVAFQSTLESFAPYYNNQPLVIGTKGLNLLSLQTMHQRAEHILGAHVHNTTLTISGPSFAREMIEGHPTAVVLAGHDEALCATIARAFFCDTFRVYTTQDVMGVEIGGALKNVIAIAAGAISGMGFGANTQAALITRGLSEMARIAVAMGANPLTLAGLSGMGDLVLTCTGPLSRNRTLGYTLGQGQSLQSALSNLTQVAEGYHTAQAAYQLALSLNVHAPITTAVYNVLYQNMPIQQALLGVLRREPGREWEE